MKIVDTRTNKMLVSVVLDRSGSMNSARAGTISGYNEYITGLRGDKASEYSVTLIQFDCNGAASTPELTVCYEDKPLAEVPALTMETYEPRGSTPLYDAIGECVRRVDARGRAVTIVIITDGQENASCEFTRQSVKELLKGKEKEGWTVAFLGANIDSFAVGFGLGINPIHTANYAVGNEKAVYGQITNSTIHRSHLSATMGMVSASAVPMFDDQQRVLMENGPAAGATTAPPVNPVAKKRPGRQWKQSSAEPVAKS